MKIIDQRESWDTRCVVMRWSNCNKGSKIW